MATKTRKPKQTRKRNVKKDTQGIVKDNLNLFVLAIAKAAAVYYTPDSNNAVATLKRIRLAEKAIGEAKISISKMRASFWREEMLMQLTTHEESLVEKWNVVVEGEEDDDS